MFSWAAEQKVIPDNPLAGMKRPKPKPRQRAITDAEFWQLYGNAGGPLHDLLLALYLSGARPKEVRELTWDKVGEDRRTLPEHKTGKKTGKINAASRPAPAASSSARKKARRVNPKKPGPKRKDAAPTP
ncbi:MAG TPA: hypothetical protein VH092_36510 [Urbifossiella sp.]|nr:hypothetical protein [Urbifossiella sp.]